MISLDSFFETVAASSQPVLALDYDGTLAPFVVERKKAFPYPGVFDRLEMIANETNTRLIIVSGRSLNDLLPLLKLEIPLEVWGSHGCECKMINGHYECTDILPQAKEGLETAYYLCKQTLPEQLFELKPSSIAVHTRGATDEQIELIEEDIFPAFEEIAFVMPLELHYFDGGIELRAEDINKGHVMTAIVADSGNNAIAYLGDDLSDEDAFEALGSRGLKVLVREKERPTGADMCIKPPTELIEFLDQWIAYGRRNR